MTWASQYVLLNVADKVFVDEKLEVDDKIEGGATVFAVVRTHRSMSNVEDEVANKRKIWRDVSKTIYNKP